ncbi:MAG: energy transducer TonB [Gammaproteobacteria bacterium]|nr:energy transducer TonB [Gammaproteobacteria bacterium]MYJ74397.1 energy transducer TonB [Gammaproteobacteria bacterium]
MALRYTVAIALGAVATFGLLMLMRAVIANPQPAQDTGIRGEVLDFVRLVQDREVVIKDRQVKPPPPPDEPPPNQPRPDLNTDATIGAEITAVDVNVDYDAGGLADFSGDGEYLPIVKVAPIYPRRALTRNIEGHVLLEFVVTATGAVRDPVVIEAKPPGFFERAAIQAALKFKYKPKVIDGEPVEVSGVRNRIIFEMSDE